jgi:DNA-binding ferritin-like protein
MTIDELHAEMRRKFEDVQADFKDVRTEIKDLHAEMQAEFKDVRAEMQEQGEITRRHFDVVAEQFREYTRLLADGTARNTERLDDHERRIRAIEQPDT